MDVCLHITKEIDMTTSKELKKAEKAYAKALRANPRYIAINMGPNRKELRTAYAVNRRTK